MSSATWLGKGISNSDARRILGASVYVDAADGEIVISGTRWADDLRVQAEAFVAEALADLPDLSPIEAAKTYEDAIGTLARMAFERKLMEAQYWVETCSISRRFEMEQSDVSHGVRDIVHATAGAKVKL